MPDVPRPMSLRFRRFLAASQIAGGLAVFVLPLILLQQRFTVEWWYWLLLWGFGGSAIAAGAWLWRDEPRGWKLSRLLQALQIVQFRTSTFGLSILAGVQLRLRVSETEFTIGPAFEGNLAITAGHAMPWLVSINFFAIYALFALSRSGPASAGDSERYDTAPAAPPFEGSHTPGSDGGEPAPSAGTG